MSEELSAESPAGVSPLRKKISAIVLTVLVVVLVVELRAGVGHMLTGKAFKNNAPDGAFEFNKVTYADVLSMISFGPKEELIRETREEVEYRYSWFSLLRPLLSRPEAAYYVTYRNREPRMAVRHGSEAPSEEELAYIEREATGDEGGGGDGMGGNEDFGGAGGRGSGRGGPPPRDPALIALDKDGDGEISEEELDAAPSALRAADTNGDGKLSGDELRPPNSQAGEERPRRRPPLDDEEEASTSEDAPVSQPAADGGADSPATSEKPGPADKPAADKPAADKPAADKPAADKPAADKPAADKPAADKPAADKPAADKPAADKPAADKPAADKPAADKPAADKPAADKPAADKPAADERTVSESGTAQPDDKPAAAATEKPDAGTETGDSQPDGPTP